MTERTFRHQFCITLPTEIEKRQHILKEMFAETGDGCTVETPVNANWGCKHVHLGKGVYCNSNITQEWWESWRESVWRKF